MTQSEGWRLAKRVLFAKINDLNSLLGIDTGKSETILMEIGAKQMAVKTIIDWIKEVEGTADQHQSHKEVLDKEAQNDYLRYEKEN